jgi:hypothetical protein
MLVSAGETSEIEPFIFPVYEAPPFNRMRSFLTQFEILWISLIVQIYVVISRRIMELRVVSFEGLPRCYYYEAPLSRALETFNLFLAV